MYNVGNALLYSYHSDRSVSAVEASAYCTRMQPHIYLVDLFAWLGAD